MECGNCRRSFNTSVYKPMLLTCGHTLCNECLKDAYFNTLMCPFDGIKITVPLRQIPLNLEIFEYLRQYEACLNLHQTSNVTLNFTQQAVQTQNVIEKLKLLITCKQNHVLLFNINTSASYRAASKISNIRCDYCKFVWKGASYHCPICLFDLCESCYLEELQAKSTEICPALKCYNSHQLYFYSNSSDYYRRGMDFKGSLCCEICQGYWNGASYSCRICNYDICTPCKEKLVNLHYFSQTYSPYLFPGMNSNLLQYQISPYGNSGECSNQASSLSASYACSETRSSYSCIKPTCDNNHPLVLLSDLGLVDPLQSYPWKCDVCERSFIGTRYQCNICNYDMCSTCFKYFSNHTFVTPEYLKCPNSHRLIRSKDQEELYLCKVGQLGYRCNSCNSVFREESNHCRKCDFDMCDKCVAKVVACIEKGLNRKCIKGHELKWSHDTSRYYSETSGSQMKCEVCKRLFVFVGSFHCRECEVDVCVNCSTSFINDEEG